MPRSEPMHRLGVSNERIALVSVVAILIGSGAYYLASTYNTSTIKAATVTSTSTKEVTSTSTQVVTGTTPKR